MAKWHAGTSIAKAIAQHYCSSAILALVLGMHEQNKVTFETQITSDEEMLSNTQTKLGYTTEKEDTAGDQQPRRPR